ncbi:hypothetical protein ROT00_13150 [Agromyces mediolanus]|uniref:hypothetical protein n=1 Tax=Agromyces mediolanus TaxID=41986 RepID=UPI0038340BEC
MNVVAFLIAMGLFLFGMWLMGTAPHLAGVEAIVFFAGIVSIALAMAIPMNLLSRRGGA